MAHPDINPYKVGDRVIDERGRKGTVYRISERRFSVPPTVYVVPDKSPNKKAAIRYVCDEVRKLSTAELLAETAE